MVSAGLPSSIIVVQAGLDAVLSRYHVGMMKLHDFTGVPTSKIYYLSVSTRENSPFKVFECVVPTIEKKACEMLDPVKVGSKGRWIRTYHLVTGEEFAVVPLNQRLH